MVQIRYVCEAPRPQGGGFPVRNNLIILPLTHPTRRGLRVRYRSGIEKYCPKYMEEKEALQYLSLLGFFGDTLFILDEKQNKFDAGRLL